MLSESAILTPGSRRALAPPRVCPRQPGFSSARVGPGVSGKGAASLSHSSPPLGPRSFKPGDPRGSKDGLPKKGSRIGFRCCLPLLASVLTSCAAHVDVPEPQAPTEARADSGQSTLPETMQLYVPPGRPPLSSQACPFRGAPVPVCRRLDAEPVTVDKLNRSIRVRGTLATTPIGCTQRNCPSDAPYCNRVTGALLLKSPAGELILADDERPWTATSGLNCVGDASALCCGFSAMGEEVIAEGTLRAFDTEDAFGATQRLLYLQTTGFCRSREVNHETTNLSKLDMPFAAVCH